MEAASSLETLANNDQLTWCHIPESSHLQQHWYHNPK